MKTLEEMAIEQLKKRYLGKVETLQLLDIANELELKHLRHECLSAVRFAYDFFRDAADEEYLRELCGNEELEAMEQSRVERVRSRRYLRQEGSIVDRSPTIYSEQIDGENEPTYYPYEALIAGIKWPPAVDPKRREDWLSDDEFVKYFKMSKAEFKNLASFKQERRKKELMLW